MDTRHCQRLQERLIETIGAVTGPLRGYMESPDHIYKKIDRDAVERLLGVLDELSVLFRHEKMIPIKMVKYLFVLGIEIRAEATYAEDSAPINELASHIEGKIAEIYQVSDPDDFYV